MSYLFPEGSTTERGVVEVGSNITVLDGVISIPQSVATTADVIFKTVSATDQLKLDGKSVVTTVTPTAGTGISLTAVTTSGPAAAFTVNNTGVTKIVAGTNITISPAGGTGDVTINAAAEGILQTVGTAIAYTALATDEYIGVTANPTIVTLPTGVVGKTYIVKNEGAGGSTTVTGTLGQLLDGSLTKSLNNNASLSVVFRAGAWRII
jgi:hypothetical protein